MVLPRLFESLRKLSEFELQSQNVHKKYGFFFNTLYKHSCPARKSCVITVVITGAYISLYGTGMTVDIKFYGVKYTFCTLRNKRVKFSD